MELTLPSNSSKVLIKEIARSKTTKSGIITEVGEKKPWDDPDFHKCLKIAEGVVVQVGGGKILDSGAKYKMRVKVGDTVLFDMYKTTASEFGGDKYLSIDEAEIVAILEVDDVEDK